MRDLKSHSDPNIVICLAGNKCDKAEKFNLQTCEELATSIDATFIKTSALTGVGVDELFETLSRRIAEVYKSKIKAENENDLLKLGAGNPDKSQSSCC